MRLAALFSGGKDSAYALHLARQDGHEIACLITIESKNDESYMFHVPNIRLARLQAEAAGIPLIWKATEGVKELELKDLEDAIVEARDDFGIEGVVSGAIYSKYQRSRIDEMCQRLGLESISPLWKRRPKDVLEGMVDEGFEVIMSAVAADGLGGEWLGRVLDKAAIAELACLHDTCYVCTGGEGGEFETLVLDAPFFKKKLVILKDEKEFHRDSGVYRVLEARLEDK